MTGQTAGHRTPMLIPAVLIALILMIAAISPAATAAPAAQPPTAKPTVVLVHGAFADSSGWHGVIARLQDAGYPVIAPANPLRDLTDDAAYISSVISAIPGPVVLVGHSYGGEVITNAASGHANVKALVYIAAFAPDQGETGLALTGQFPGSQLGAALITRPFPLPNGVTGIDGYIDPAKFRQVFAADLPTATTTLMAATQRPVSLAALAAPSATPAWRTIPSWYLVAGSDRAIPPAAERFMAKRAHAHTIEIADASHVAMISHPTRAAGLIMKAATATT